MAKKKRTRKATTTTIVRAAPAAPRAAPAQIVVRTQAAPTRTQRAVATVRRGASRAVGAARAGLLGIPADTTAMLAAGAAVGLMKRTGILDQIPRLPYVGRIGTAAIVAHLLSRQTGSKLARDIRNALAVLASYQLASSDKPIGERIEGFGDYPSDGVIDAG